MELPCPRGLLPSRHFFNSFFRNADDRPGVRGHAGRPVLAQAGSGYAAVVFFAAATLSAPFHPPPAPAASCAPASV